MVNQADIIEYFKTEFELLMQKFNDTRQLNYTMDYMHKEGLVECNWFEEKIKIIFCIRPINYYLKNPEHNKIFNDNPKSYRNYFMQVARHEYGHSISCESFEKIHSYILPFNEFVICWKKKQFFNIYLNNIFFDFIANYLVFKKINDTIPEEYIKINIFGLQTAYQAGYKIFELIKVCLLHSQIFYIFKKWNELEKFFSEFNIYVFLDFIYTIYEIFEQIIKKNSNAKLNINIDSAVADIGKLAIILNKFDYKKMILQNYFDKTVFQLLKNFKNKLSKITKK